jgi:hypothetical protein
LKACVLQRARGLMPVYVVSSELYIQELSQLYRSTGRFIGFPSYYSSRVESYGRVLFSLQLTVTRVLFGRDGTFETHHYSQAMAMPIILMQT